MKHWNISRILWALSIQMQRKTGLPLRPCCTLLPPNHLVFPFASIKISLMWTIMMRSKHSLMKNFTCIKSTWRTADLPQRKLPSSTSGGLFSREVKVMQDIWQCAKAKEIHPPLTVTTPNALTMHSSRSMVHNTQELHLTWVKMKQHSSQRRTKSLQGELNFNAVSNSHPAWMRRKLLDCLKFK